MKIGIVGPISKDKVQWPNGETISKFGAVVYTATALAKLFEGSTDEVICLSHLSTNDLNEVDIILNHPNIRMDFISATGDDGTEIDLRYINKNERVSTQTRVMKPISFNEINALKDCEYIILMPLNETDIGLDTVLQFRNMSDATIFLDLHGLITGVDDKGKRYKKNWEQSKDWLKFVDILKMNEKEASWAAGRFLKNFSDYLKFAADIVKSKLVACWITFGDESSLVVWRRDSKIYWANVPVTEAGEVVDTIGCGDTASAGFIYAYAKLHSPLVAVVMGNMLGSVKASTCEATDFPTQPEVRSMIFKHYRDYFHNLLDEFLSQQHLIVNEIKEDIEHEDEDLMYGSNGDRHYNGTDHARSSDSQGSSAAWS